MTKILADIKTQTSWTSFGWSKDWNTKTPWEHKGTIVPYFASRKWISKSGDVHFTALYIGPLAIMRGKWIGS